VKELKESWEQEVKELKESWEQEVKELKETLRDLEAKRPTKVNST